MAEQNWHLWEEQKELDNLLVENQEDVGQNSSNSKTSLNQDSAEAQQNPDAEYITPKDVCLVFLFGFVLPTLDQGTDYYTAANLINNENECRYVVRKCYGYPRYWTEENKEENMQNDEARLRRYGYAMLAPILLMTVFSLRQWWRLEKKHHRWLTFPLVILQLYPQYRAIRVLYLGLMKKTSWRKEKDIFDRDLSSLEPFIESVPQIHILLCLAVSNDSRLDAIFLLTLATSIASGGFGIAKFLKSGPCKIIPSNGRFLDGFVSLGLPAVVLSILATLVGKGFLLPVVAGGPGVLRTSFLRVLMWVGLNLVPPFLYAFIILCVSLGFKRACVISFNYPALILTPSFGTWTFGPAKQNTASSSTCCTSCKSNVLEVSYFHTWVNYAISVIGSIGTFFLWIEVNDRWDLEDVSREFEYMFRNNLFFRGHFWGVSSLLMSWILMILILPLSITFVQAVDNCCSCLCKCCPTQCFPVIEKTKLQLDKKGNAIFDVEEQNKAVNLAVEP